MLKIALIGAGGKMGCRITRNLKPFVGEYRIHYVENSPAGQERLRALGVNSFADIKEAAAWADVVVLAIPDKLIGTVGKDIIPLMRSGAMAVSLDPAAAYAGVLPDRKDISYFVSHPCHPPLFNDETDPAARTDWFGGQGLAKQDIVCAIHQGTDDDYANGEALAMRMFAPVMKSHRVTVEQMAFLEPALVESFGSCLVAALKEGMDRVVALGVPRDAALSFVMGHTRIQIAVLFGFADFPFSDGAYLAMNKARDKIFKPTALDEMFDAAMVKQSVNDITSAH